jgi:hypothetical protein
MAQTGEECTAQTTQELECRADRAETGGGQKTTELRCGKVLAIASEAAVGYCTTRVSCVVCVSVVDPDVALADTVMV